MNTYGPSNIVIRLQSSHIPAKRRLSKLNTDSSRKKKQTYTTLINESQVFEEEEHSDQEEVHWACHTQVLYLESPYFASLLGDNFGDSKSNTTYLPSSIIDSTAFSRIIHYMYTHEIQQPKSLKELCDMYSAADYLGMDTLCILLAKRLTGTVHDCVCYCQTCISAVPELFPFCRTRSLQLQDEKMAILMGKVITILTGDPKMALSTFWTTRHMARLLQQLPQDISQALSHKVLHRVNKSNAIESLYACFNASNTLSTNDPLLSWSKPLHATLTSIQSRATRTIARHFDYFCSQYPALLSCIDGITYSFEFLEYLLLHILEDQMDCSNVGVLYKGIVCDLISRHAVQYNDQVKHILNVAKVMILQYITRRIGDIRQQGGLDNLQKDVLNHLADDLDVRSKALISSKHPLFHRGFFSFLIPSIPNLTLSSQSAHTNGLSRHSSHSTLHTRHVNLPERSLSHTTIASNMSRSSFLTRLFRKLSGQYSQQHRHSHATLLSKKNRVTNRTLSSSTTRTTFSTTSWSQIKISQLDKKESKFFTRIKKKTSLEEQVSASMVGMHRRVQLTRRPTLTVGTVVFIGRVNFAEGLWIGVELDRRVGKNDGSVDGYRYFTSSPNRGVFVRPEDVSIVV